MISYCPECKCDCKEEGIAFCSTCGTKILARNPEICVDVEIEGQGSRCMSLDEFFDTAKERGLIK